MKYNQLYILLISISIITLQSCKHNKHNDFQAPTGQETGLLNITSRACYFADSDSVEKQTQIKIDAPSAREVEQITSIMEYTGLPQNFKIYRGDIDNALATVVNNQRLIIYNKDLFSVMDKMSSSYWTSMFIIAHEIGHHLAFNISDTSNMLNAELEADKFAGFILFKMGADSNQVTEAISSGLISAVQDSKTHPSKNKRIETVKKSWKESNGLRFLSAVPPPLSDHFSQAAYLSYVYNRLENHLNGYPEFYHPRGYNDYQLVYNDYGFSMMDSIHYDNYSLNRRSDSSIYDIFPSVSRNYQGIIVDVQKKHSNPSFSNIVLLEIGILITKIDSAYNFAGLIINKRYQFLVSFSNRGNYTQDILSYQSFFAGGRRLEFDILYLHEKEGKNGLYSISRAYSL